FRDDAEVAGERELETDAEAITAIGRDHRLGAARRRGDVPGEARDGLRARLHEALDIAAARKMLAGGAQHDDPYPRVLFERLEHQPKLVALRHGDDVERRAIEGHVGALARGVDLDAKALEGRKAGIDESRAHVLLPWWRAAVWCPDSEVRMICAALS